MPKPKPPVDPFTDCCGTCRYAHINEFKDLTCWVEPPTFAGHFEGEDAVFLSRGQGIIKAIDPACQHYTPRNPQ